MKLNTKFFHRDCLDVAPDLVGKVIVRKFENGDLVRLRITETEALERNCFTVKAE